MKKKIKELNPGTLFRHNHAIFLLAVPDKTWVNPDGGGNYLAVQVSNGAVMYFGGECLVEALLGATQTLQTLLVDYYR